MGLRYLSKMILGCLSTGALIAGLVGSLAAQQSSLPAGHDDAANPSLYVKVRLNQPLKVSKMHPGDVVEGTLAGDVYSADRELFSKGSSVRLRVDHMEKRRRPADDHWPWVVKAFTPRHQMFPVFTAAKVLAGDRESDLRVSLISISRKREVYAQEKKKKSNSRDETGTVEVSRSGGVYGSGKLALPVMVLEAFPQNAPRVDDNALAATDLPTLQTLPAGTPCKILLLGDVSASKSKAGDVLKARLLEPVVVNSQVVLPAGTLIDGRVVKRTPPRWGSRAGSLALTFTGLTLPGGNFVPMTASLTGAELDRASHTRIDAEGKLQGERPGKVWMAINIGVTAGLAKEVDDATQLIIEAVVSTATDASTAGAARIVSSCISGIYMVSRHGRDVVLPRFTEMNISLDRPLSVTRTPESANASTMNEHGN